MKVLILAAGYGTRLQSVAKDTAKPLLPVAGRPIIDYLLEMAKGCANLSEVVVVTNEKFHLNFQEWAARQSHYSVPVSVVNDGTRTPEDRLGSVGDIHFAVQQKGINEDLLVIGGDNLFDQCLPSFAQEAASKAPAVTIGVYDIGDKSGATKFGVVEVNAQAKVIGFEEKPANPKSSLVAMCCYYFPRATLGLIREYMTSSQKTDNAGNYIQWLTQKSAVYGFKFQGKWYDIGSIESYQDAQERFQTRTS